MDNYQDIRKELRGITPLKYGVPYEQVFNQLWHYMFAVTNRKVVEAGMFADPYDERRPYQGFISAVWSPSLYDLSSF